MMDHKAFQFDFAAFNSELRLILEDALYSENCTILIQFISDHLINLKDPYEGKPLEKNWESMIDQPDSHQYGDFALTKYYDPATDIGLGPTWDDIQEIISRHPDLMESPVLGSVIGPRDRPFDPGKMGAYFQSEEQVAKNREFLASIGKDSGILQKAIDMLTQTEAAKKGLYVTF